MIADAALVRLINVNLHCDAAPLASMSTDCLRVKSGCVLAEGCHFASAQHNAISVRAGSEVLLYKCAVTEARYFGCTLSGGSAHLVDSRIDHCGSAGVFCRGDARSDKHKAAVSMSRNTISNCDKAVYFDSGSHAVIADSNRFIDITSRPACHVAEDGADVFFE